MQVRMEGNDKGLTCGNPKEDEGERSGIGGGS